MDIITGHTGEEGNVRAVDDMAMYFSAMGRNGILENLDNLAVTITGSYKVKVGAGDILIGNGCHARVRYGQEETLTLDAGTSGYSRKDIIVAQYVNNNGIESVSLKIKKGTNTTNINSAVAPEPVFGDIQKGAVLSEELIATVSIVNLQATNVEMANVTQSINSASEGLGGFIRSVYEELMDKEAEYKRKFNELDEIIQTIQRDIARSVEADSGRISTVTVSANSYTDVDINFNHEFVSIPRVVSSLVSASGTATGYGNMSIVLRSITNNGAQVRVFNASSADRTTGVHWVAVAPNV